MDNWNIIFDWVNCGFFVCFDISRHFIWEYVILIVGIISSISKETLKFKVTPNWRGKCERCRRDSFPSVETSTQLVLNELKDRSKRGPRGWQISIAFVVESGETRIISSINWYWNKCYLCVPKMFPTIFERRRQNTISWNWKK